VLKREADWHWAGAPVWSRSVAVPEIESLGEAMGCDQAV